MRNILLLLITLFIGNQGLCQSQRFKNYPARSVGPVIQGARIIDIAVNPENKKEFLIGFASGGVFKTTNNGVNFFPIFDEQGSMTIGDMAIAPSNPNIIYVGTGENNSSRSSYAGDGVYRSDDGGKSWKNLGLEKTQHIGRVVVHPKDPDIVWVAAMGGLYSENSERGVYKTTNGGKSWKKVLFVNDETGAIDLALHPEDPNTLLASMWQRKRYAWDFVGNGEGSGVYKSIDGGASWNLAMSGMPHDKFSGRIGLAYYPGDPSIVYAVMDYQKESKEKLSLPEDEGLSLSKISKMSIKDFLKLSNETLDDFLKQKRFPKKYNAVNVKNEIQKGVYDLKDIANYFGDANEALFNTQVAGAIVYRSDDNADNWVKTHDYDLEGVFYTYGYYFGEIRVSPTDEDEIYVLGVPLIKSTDGGKTFARTDTIGNVHGDHQSMWIDPSDSDHIILGNDGGLYISYDKGASWDHRNNMSVGQFYTVNVDMEQPYNIYGGLQDNGTLVGSSKTVPTVRGDWDPIFGGDGMYVSADPRNADVVYVGYQFGNYYRLDRAKSKSAYITPSHDIGSEKLRFNWRTPVILSNHNPDIVYFGSQKVHRSLNQGNTWEDISEDLTRGAKDGNVPYGTITEIAESPLKFGLLYAGTDDGNVWSYTTLNGWRSLNKGLPEGLWVSSIHPSIHSESTVYLSLTGYRKDDFKTYVYKSDDYGKSWKSISTNISAESVNVIYEDLKYPELLFLGTDNGTYMSLNTGNTWERIHSIPNVASYDMVIHPREHELVVGTHGRSVYVIELNNIHQLLDQKSSKNIVALQANAVRHSKSWGTKRYPYLKPYIPEIELPVFINSGSGLITVSITDEEAKLLSSFKRDLTHSGFYNIIWNGKVDGTDNSFIEPGKYTVSYNFNGEESTVNLEVK